MEKTYALRYRIRALEPLIITSKTGDPNIVATLDYIPGTQIRGLFANEYIKIKKTKIAEEDIQFRSWFLDGNLKFLNAYISDTVNEESRVYYPIPLCLQREKYGSEVYNLFNSGDSKPDTKPIDSYGHIIEETIFTKTVKKTINFHHKRDRQRGVSEEGIIFNYESIDREQTFEGLILGQRDLLSEFKSKFSEGLFQIGRSRHAQYGRIEFKMVSDEPFDFPLPEIDISENEEIILYLISDTIILNDYGFSTANLRDFENATGLKVEKSIIRISDEEGYISVWRARTPSYTCFKAGSSFLIKAEEDTVSTIQNLWSSGIGEMTESGFGRFMILQNISKVNERRSEEEMPEKPKEMTKTAEDVLFTIIKRAITKEVEKEAIDRANQFTEGSMPPSSLLSKIEKSIRDKKLETVLRKMEGKQAKANLEKLNDGKLTLYDFLLNPNFNLEKIIVSASNLDRIIKEIPIAINFSEMEKRLKERYLITFISILRKRAKIIKGGK